MYVGMLRLFLTYHLVLGPESQQPPYTARARPDLLHSPKNSWDFLHSVSEHILCSIKIPASASINDVEVIH